MFTKAFFDHKVVKIQGLCGNDFKIEWSGLLMRYIKRLRSLQR